MHPRNGSPDHPSAALLSQYATDGCPVDCGQPWTIEELQQAVNNGAHKSAFSSKAVQALQKESLAHVAEKGWRIVK